MASVTPSFYLKENTMKIDPKTGKRVVPEDAKKDVKKEDKKK